MSKRMSLALLLCGLLLPAGALAGERTVTLAIANMTCALCPITVREAIGKVPGVSLAQVDFHNGTAVVTFDDQVSTVEQLAEASTNAGYPARPAE